MNPDRRRLIISATGVAVGGMVTARLLPEEMLLRDRRPRRSHVAIIAAQEYSESLEGVRAVADRAHICRSPQRGETWRLQGTFGRHSQFGEQLRVEKAWPLKPDGRAVAHYLTHHPAFRGIGIGPAKVARLCKMFGDGLVALLDQGDIDELSRILDSECAGTLIQRWRQNARDASVVAFLDAKGVDVRLASKVLRYWPDRTIEKLQENP